MNSRLVQFAAFSFCCGLFGLASAQPRPQGIISDRIGSEVAAGVSASVLSRIVKLNLEVVATKGRVASALFQRSNNLYLQHFADDTLIVWDFEQGVQIDEVRLPRGSLPLHFDPVSRRLVAIADGRFVQGERSRDGKFEIRPIFDEAVHAAVTSGDGRSIFAATKDGELVKLSPTGSVVWRAKIAASGANRIASSHDGTRVTVLDATSRAVVLDDQGRSIAAVAGVAVLGQYDQSGRQIHLLASGEAVLVAADGATSTRKMPIGTNPRRIAVSQSGEHLAVVSADGKLSVAGRDGWTSVDSDVADALFLSDNKYLSVRTNGVTHLRSVGVAHYLLAIIPGTLGWVIVDHEGRYDGTVAGTKDVRWKAEKDGLSLEQFFESYFRPGLLAAYVKEQEGRALEALPAKVREGVFLPPKVELEFPEGKLKPGTAAKIVAVAESNGGDLRDEIRVFHNGKRLAQKARLGSQKIQKDGRLLLVQVFSFIPEPGSNEVFAEAHNAHGIAGGFEVKREVTEGFRSQGKLHVLGIGIDQYRLATMNLGFATADVKVLVNKISEGARRGYEEVLPQFVIDGEATSVGVKQFLSRLAQIPPQDSLILVLAGHGDLHKGEWYFLPHDVDPNDIPRSAVSVRELQTALVDSPVRRIFVMVDACNSGAGIDAFNSYRAFQRKFAEQLGRTAGISVLTATRRDQFAAELSKLGHGLFTHVILEGLAGAADTNPKDGRITAHELANFVGRHLEEKGRPFLGPLGLAQSPAHFVIGSDFLVSDIGR